MKTIIRTGGVQKTVQFKRNKGLCFTRCLVSVTDVQLSAECKSQYSVFIFYVCINIVLEF